MRSPDKALDGHNNFSPWWSLDDVVFQQWIAVWELQDKVRRSVDLTAEEKSLWCLLQLGTYDVYNEDKPLDAATRAMGYSAAGLSHLWEIVRRKDSQVCFALLFLIQLSLTNFPLDRSLGAEVDAPGEEGGY